jgi:hypothetical protein
VWASTSKENSWESQIQETFRPVEKIFTELKRYLQESLGAEQEWRKLLDCHTSVMGTEEKLP